MNSMGATWEMKNRKEIDAFRMCFGFGSFFLFLSLAHTRGLPKKRNKLKRDELPQNTNHTQTPHLKQKTTRIKIGKKCKHQPRLTARRQMISFFFRNHLGHLLAGAYGQHFENASFDVCLLCNVGPTPFSFPFALYLFVNRTTLMLTPS